MTAWWRLLPRENAAAPAGFESAPVVETGDAFVIPGLIDLHNHLGYNALPLWAEPTQKKPFLHHNDWPDKPSYKPDISWPAWVLAKGDPEAIACLRPGAGAGRRHHRDPGLAGLQPSAANGAAQYR